MKIIHTSDLHIASPLTSRLSARRAARRRKEIAGVPERLAMEARRIGASVIMIAGDLFDSEKVTAEDVEKLRDVISAYSDLKFVYVMGNHEGGTLKKYDMPDNFVSATSDEWQYIDVGELRISARAKCFPGMFDDLEVREGVNIALLHGELSNSKSEGAVNLNEAAKAGINYLAMGHYHSYSAITVTDSCVAVYSGTPEGRGFDEVGECGYVLVDTDGGVSHKFVPFSIRTLHDISLDTNGKVRTLELESMIKSTLSKISEDDLVKLRLTGERRIEEKPDAKALTERLTGRFAHIEVIDETRPEIKPEELMYDKTLKGEFIRLVLADAELEENEKYRIIDCGIKALLGEAFDE